MFRSQPDQFLMLPRNDMHFEFIGKTAPDVSRILWIAPVPASFEECDLPGIKAWPILAPGDVTTIHNSLSRRGWLVS